MSLIIIDRKRKRSHSDYDWTDAMGTEAAKEAKIHHIQVNPNSDCLVDKFICKHGGIGKYDSHKCILGKRLWAKKDRSYKILEGCVVDIYPSRYLLVQVNGKNVPVKFENVIEIKDDTEDR